jgi:anti-sigma regulatory factor (Ser/Thr protein kinase)
MNMKPGGAVKGPVHLRITSEPARLAEVRETVAEKARQIGFGEEQVGKMVLAVDEALCNVIKHGYGCEPGRPIELTISEDVGSGRVGLAICLRDYGRQVDPQTIRSRDLREVRPGGLGVHIINSLMDEVEYSQAEGGGMRLRLCKYLAAE